MRSMSKTEPAAPRSQSFSFRSAAVDPAVHIKMAAVFIVALMTVIAAGVMTLHPSNASQAEDLASYSGSLTAGGKGDRVAALVGAAATQKTCVGQAWGAWSEDCAAALSGARKVRKVSFVTVEARPRTVNETILARYPANN